MATANVLYCNRITSTNFVGIYFTDRIVTAAAMMIVMFLFDPKIWFLLRTVYTTKKMTRARRSLAKRYSSKEFMSQITSPMNLIKI